jgi:hypothetical protein
VSISLETFSCSSLDDLVVATMSDAKKSASDGSALTAMARRAAHRHRHVAVPLGDEPFRRDVLFDDGAGLLRRFAERPGAVAGADERQAEGEAEGGGQAASQGRAGGRGGDHGRMEWGAATLAACLDIGSSANLSKAFCTHPDDL